MNPTNKKPPVPHPKTVAIARKTPVAPPVYRPQPIPKVLQRKTSSTQHALPGQAPRQPVAPPVYRPQAHKLVQPQIVPPQRMSPKAPPVYRPERKGMAQPKSASIVPAQIKTKVTPIRGLVPRASGARQHVIQRTTWRFKSGAWTSESAASSDTDLFDGPDAYCAKNGITAGENDKYDQNTGEYFSWDDARSRTEERGERRTRPKGFGDFFDASRERTPYARFVPRGAKEKRNAGLQGPHLAAHVLKRTVFDIAAEMGLRDVDILGSKLAPKPKQALRMMKDMLSERGIVYKEAALSTWYEEYKAAYALFESGKKGSKKAKKQVLEAHPIAVYRIGEKASAAELAAKDECASAALDDIDLMMGAAPAASLPAGLRTVDYGFQNEGWAPGDQLRADYIRNLCQAASGRPPSPSPYPEEPKSPPRKDDW